MPKVGGARKNAGRRAGSGRFREPTRAMRIPESLVGVVSEMLEVRMREAASVQVSTTTNLVIERSAPGAVTILPPIEALVALEAMADQGIQADVVMIDPWYRAKGPAGRGAYLTEVVPLLAAAAKVGQHVFLWGLPETLARVVDHWPSSLKLESWLTWSYTNVPSRRRGWRPNSQACLHLRRTGSHIYPERFYAVRHRVMAEQNRLEFKLGPFAAWQEALMSGFIKKAERTAHPSQKPVSVFERLLRMTVSDGGMVVDVTGGSGTSAIAALRLGCSAIVSDRSPRWTKLMRERISQELGKLE